VLKQPPQQVSFTGAHLRLLRFLIAPDAIPAVTVDFSGLTTAARARRQKYGELNVDDLRPVAVVLMNCTPNQVADGFLFG
jgi:hypothetical protein